MRVARVDDEVGRRELFDAVVAADSLRCDPEQARHPSWDELRGHSNVVAVFDETRPLMFALQSEGRINWLSHIDASSKAANALAEWIFESEGHCSGTVVAGDVRELFNHPNIWHGPSGVYLEWRP